MLALASVAAVLAVAVVAVAGDDNAGGGGMIVADDVGVVQINSSDPLTEPVLLNGHDVLSIIKMQASLIAEQASVIDTQSREIAALSQHVCGLREPALTFVKGAGSDQNKWAGGVLAPNGLIYSVPYTATSVLIISPTTNALDITTIAGLPSDIYKWWGGVLAPSNNNI